MRPGYEFTNGWLTGQPAIVVTVAQKKGRMAGADRLPDTLGGFPVDVEQASPLQAQRITNLAKFFKDAALRGARAATSRPADGTHHDRRLHHPAARPIAAPHREPEITYTPRPRAAHAGHCTRHGAVLCEP